MAVAQESFGRAGAAAAPSSRLRSVLKLAVPLGAVLLIAAALRLPHVGQALNDSFSWREASTAMMADNFHQRNWNVLYPEVSWTGPGPSYQGREFQVVSYITALLYAAFGWHDWFGRAVAAGFGLWSVVALHRLVERLAGRAQANAAALMLAVMPGAAIIDSSFLPDPAMLAFALTALWALTAWLQTDRWWLLPLAAVFVALSVLAKPPGMVVLAPAAYLAASILARRGALTRGRLLRLAAALLAAAAPVVAYFSWAVWLGSNTPPYHVAGSGYLWEDFAGAVRSAFYLPAAAWHANLWFVTVPFFLLFGLGCFAAAPSSTRAGPWVFHVWLAAGAALYLFAAEEITNNPWNLLIFAAPIAGLAGRGLIAVTRSADGDLDTWPARVRLAGVLAVVVFAGVAGIEVMKRPYADSSREVGVRLAALAGPDDLVIATGTTVGDPIAVYYSRRRGWVFPPGGGQRPWDRLQPDAAAIASLDALRAEGADWFGMTRDTTDSAQRRLLDHNPGLIDHLDRVGERVVDDERVLIWRLSGAAEPG